MTFLNNFPKIKISHVLYTHKHYDHAGGAELMNYLLYSKYKNDIDFIASKIDGEHI